MQELTALREVQRAGEALRQTAPVDDDFPEMMHYFDSALRNAKPLINTASDKIEHFNNLSPAEAERVALLLEECGEVVQICGKILRHGFESRHPAGTQTNRLLLAKELGDVEAAVMMMNNAGDIADCMVKGNAKLKLQKVRAYLHHQPKHITEF